jgi:hypothetical protein
MLGQRITVKRSELEDAARATYGQRITQYGSIVTLAGSMLPLLNRSEEGFVDARWF